MSDDPFADDTRRLTDAFWRRLRDAGAPNPEALATELVHMARGHGWRAVEALQPAVTPTTGGGTGLPEEYRQRRAALEARPPCGCDHVVLDHALVCGTRGACSRCGCPAYTPERSQ
jgi:hypothetical protein